MPNGLVAHYTFTNDVRQATVGANLTGGFNPTLVADKEGNENAALKLDSVGGVAGLKLINPAICESAFTVTVFVKIDKLPRTASYTNGPIFSMIQGGAQWFERIVLGTNANQYMALIANNALEDDLGGRVYQEGNYEFEIWDHLGMVINGGNVELYVNGEFQEDFSIAGFGNCQVPEAFIGHLIYNQREAFSIGAMDDLRVYSRALTGSEVEDVYNEDFAGFIALGVESAKVSTITLSPNPAIGSLNLKGIDMTAYSTVEIVNTLGTVVGTHEVNATEMNINLENVSEGIYFARFLGTNPLTIKFQVGK